MQLGGVGSFSYKFEYLFFFFCRDDGFNICGLFSLVIFFSTDTIPLLVVLS